jgi:hypothetical protein
MSGQLGAGVAILIGFVVVIGVVSFVAHRKSRDIQPGMPDRLSDEVVSGLMTELRKTQAEVAHWKAAAERLQRELDGRS